MKILSNKKFQEKMEFARLRGKEEFIEWLRGQTIYTKPVTMRGDGDTILDCVFLDNDIGLKMIGGYSKIFHCRCEKCGYGIYVENPHKKQGKAKG